VAKRATEFSDLMGRENIPTVGCERVLDAYKGGILESQVTGDASVYETEF
jgi:hypothetical protein